MGRLPVLGVFGSHPQQDIELPLLLAGERQERFGTQPSVSERFLLDASVKSGSTARVVL